MEKVEVSRETLEFFARELIGWYEWDALDVTWEHDRKVARHMDELISALGLQEALTAERKQRDEEAAAAYRARKAAEEAEQAGK